MFSWQSLLRDSKVLDALLLEGDVERKAAFILAKLGPYGADEADIEVRRVEFLDHGVFEAPVLRASDGPPITAAVWDFTDPKLVLAVACTCGRCGKVFAFGYSETPDELGAARLCLEKDEGLGTCDVCSIS
jgi:hypothetical protein